MATHFQLDGDHTCCSEGGERGESVLDDLLEFGSNPDYETFAELVWPDVTSAKPVTAVAVVGSAGTGGNPRWVTFEIWAGISGKF